MTEHHVIWQAIFPLGTSDPLHLPVRDLEQAVPYYERFLGCTVVSRQDHPFKEIVLQKDQIRLGLTENGGIPEEHSCVIAVSDVDAVRQQLAHQQLDISDTRQDTHGHQTYRVFFLRAPDGLCFCFSQRA
jgi:catechol 2,3-dioxygenase-like lactoylglutathione lyase family enzyme